MLNGIPPFADILLHYSPFAEAVSELWNGKSISVDGVVGSSCALAAAAIAQAGDKPVLVIVPETEVERVCDDLDLFVPTAGGSVNLVFPALKPSKLSDEDEVFALADDLFGQRIRALKELTKNKKTILVTSFDALCQPVPTRELLTERTQTLAVGNRVDLEKLRRFLVEGGYHNTSAVDLPGEFAVRGYIFDLFAPDWDKPVRIEFFDDEIESIRRFDIATQRSLETVNEVNLTRLMPNEAVGATLFDYLPPTSPIILLEPQEFKNST
jgi:transcription-repair coupling factor (superfamily II helicase)